MFLHLQWSRWIHLILRYSSLIWVLENFRVLQQVVMTAEAVAVATEGISSCYRICASNKSGCCCGVWTGTVFHENETGGVPPVSTAKQFLLHRQNIKHWLELSPLKNRTYISLWWNWKLWVHPVYVCNCWWMGTGSIDIDVFGSFAIGCPNLLPAGIFDTSRTGCPEQRLVGPLLRWIPVKLVPVIFTSSITELGTGRFWKRILRFGTAGIVPEAVIRVPNVSTGCVYVEESKWHRRNLLLRPSLLWYIPETLAHQQTQLKCETSIVLGIDSTDDKITDW